MNHESAGDLPSLICQFVMSPALAAERDEEPIHKPPFPGVNLRWDGFILPALHLVSISTNILHNARRACLAGFHEMGHRQLRFMPFSVIKKMKLYRLYFMISMIFSGKEEQIRVPLTADKSGNDLQKELAILLPICRESKLVEEVYAVRSSLFLALQEGLIKPKHLPLLVNSYNIGYEKYIPGYIAAYEAFDFVARKIGQTAASAVIHSTLDTLNPRVAFYDILWVLCQFNPDAPNDLVWNLPKDVTEYLADLSFEKARNFFTADLLEEDPDGSRYGIKKLFNAVETVEENMSLLVQLCDDDDFLKLLSRTPHFLIMRGYSHSSLNGKDATKPDNDFLKWLWGAPNHFFLTGHNHSTISQTLIRKDITKPEEVFEKDVVGETIILLEAIFQQLTQGNGLLCPWFSSTSHCCGEETRNFLENVWECTVPSPTCKRWERLGCLRQRS